VGLDGQMVCHKYRIAVNWNMKRYEYWEDRTTRVQNEKGESQYHKSSNALYCIELTF